MEHIQLIDPSGNPDHHAFMEFKQELWSPDGKRLTVLFDPGRIKRGVSTNLERGPALLAGNSYQLIISGAWQDVYGQEIVETRKEFAVIQPYRQQLNVNDWKIHQPKAYSCDPLGIQFDRVIDHALVQSMIHIEDEGKNLIGGRFEILEQEVLLQLSF